MKIVRFLALFVFFFPQLALGDGAIIPTYTGKLPEIPSQRAIVRHYNGIETLVIETEFDGKGQKFGWIIPIPNIPNRFEELDQDVFYQLSVATQAKVIHLHGLTFKIVFFLIILTIICISIAYKAYRFLKIFFYGSVIAIILFIVILPNFISYRGSESVSSSGIEIIDKQIVGDYNISVIKANNSEALNKWLVDNGYIALEDRALEIAKDYIEKNWYFVGAKLIRQDNVFSTINPILIEFNSRKPIYPIRLTALTTDNINLELFIISNKEASTTEPLMDKVYLSKFKQKKIVYVKSLHGKTIEDKEKIVHTLFVEDKKNQAKKIAIGGKNMRKLLWDGCIITKFKGNISSSQLSSDFKFNFRKTGLDVQYYRKEKYSYNISILFAGTPAYLFGLLCFSFIKFSKPRMSKLIKKHVILILVFPAIIFITIYVFMGDKVPIRKIRCSHNATIFDAKNAFTATQAFFTDNENMLPAVKNLKEYGFDPFGCSIIIIEGKNQDNLSIISLPLHGFSRVGKTYIVNSKGEIYQSEIKD